MSRTHLGAGVGTAPSRNAIRAEDKDSNAYSTLPTSEPGQPHYLNKHASTINKHLVLVPLWMRETELGTLLGSPLKKGHTVTTVQ